MIQAVMSSQCKPEKYQNQIFIILEEVRVTSGGAHLRGLGPATQLRRNVAAMPSRRRHCVRFDWLGNRTPDLKRQYRRLTLK